jgi:hypothetical protein
MSIFLDLFGDDYRDYERQAEANRRHGACEDDYEAKCPYIGMLPDESEHEDGSPLDFSTDRAQLLNASEQEIDDMILEAYKRGE